MLSAKKLPIWKPIQGGNLFCNILRGFGVALVQASLLFLGVNFTRCDPSKEVTGGRLVDLGSTDSVVESEALEGIQGAVD